MQFGEVAADMVLFRFWERDMQFCNLEFDQLFKIQGHILITGFCFMYDKTQQLIADNL